MANKSKHMKAASVLMAFAAMAVGPIEADATDTLKEVYERYGRSSIAAPFRDSSTSKPQAAQPSAIKQALPIEAPDFATSSFAALNLRVNGMAVDQRIDQALLAAFPNHRMKLTDWRDSQNRALRKHFGNQTVATGHINASRDHMMINVTPWHAGSLIRKLDRKVSINYRMTDQMPTEEDFIAAVIDQLGESPVDDERKAQIFRQTQDLRFRSLIYPIKYGAISNVPCWHPHVDCTARSGPVEKTAERALALIDEGWCDAILIYHFARNSSHKGRIQQYGTVLRDFRLEAHSTIQDVALKRAETAKRQASTPSVAPRL